MANVENERSIDRSRDEKSLCVGQWWRESTLWVLLIAVGIAYFSRMTERPMRGEETRRGLVAIEMIQSGDWIVPREQGELFLSRPPLQNWIILGVASITGHVDCWSIRFPSVIALMLTVMMLYGYARQFLSQTCATAAALSYATTGQVLEMGALGETESMYTLMVGGSLILWHWGWTAGWNGTLTWSIGYALAAAGMLTKGPQAPIYFVVPVAAFFLLTGQWRMLMTRSHAIGVLVFLALWNAWNIPFWMRVGTESMIGMYRNDIALRFNNTGWSPLLKHLVSYPLEIMACLLPWSLLLPAFLMPSFWRARHRVDPLITFHMLAIGITFFSVWFVTGAKARYYMPLYPCFSVLVAIILQRCFRAEAEFRLKRSVKPIPENDGSSPWIWVASWRRFQIGAIAMMTIGLSGVIVAMFTSEGQSLVSNPIVAAIVVSSVMASLITLIRSFRSPANGLSETNPLFERQQIRSLMAIGGFIWVAYFGVAMNPIIERTLDVSADVAKVKTIIPNDETLWSTARISHLFTFHFGKTIPIAGLDPALLHENARYVCYYPDAAPRDTDEFHYDVLAEVSVVSDNMAPRSVIVTRRSPLAIAKRPSEASSNRH